MSTMQNELLRGLMDLQELDHEIRRIQRRLGDGPRLVERRTEGLRQAVARLEVAVTKTKKVKAHVAELELELKSREVEINRLAGQQNSAKTNQEYKALGDHMERIRKECAELEDQILENMSQVEELELEEKVQQQARDERQGEAQELQEAWQRDEGEYESELEKIKARRDEFCESLARGPLEIYQKVLQAYDGEAVVSAEGRNCGGCHMALTPNDVARLQAMSNELITCRSCGRILFLP